MTEDHAEVIVAMVTPFRRDLSVDYDQAARLSRRLVDDGADGILVGGTTGEAPTLSEEEKMNLLGEVLESVGDDAEVWMGTGTNDTESTVRLSKEAGEAGAHGLMMVTPYYNKPPEVGLYRHFSRAARCTELPVMVYNVPSRTGVNLKPETVGKLADISNVVAVKEASGDVNQALAIGKLTGPDFLLYSGDDSLTLPILSAGGHGVVTVAGHLVPGKLKRMIRAYKKGRVDDALTIHRELMPLFEAMFLTTNPIPVKAALRLVGIEVGYCRSPLGFMSDEDLSRLREILRPYVL